MFNTKLLTSSNRDDILIGLILLKDVSYEEIVENTTKIDRFRALKHEYTYDTLDIAYKINVGIYAYIGSRHIIFFTNGNIIPNTWQTIEL